MLVASDPLAAILPFSSGTPSISAVWPMAMITLSAGDGEVGSFDRHRTAAPRAIRLAQLHAQAFEAGHAATAGDDLDGVRQQLELHALFFGLLDFFGQRGHFGTTAAVDHGDFFRAHAQGRAGGVHGDVAAADHDRLSCPMATFSPKFTGPRKSRPYSTPASIVAGQSPSSGSCARQWRRRWPRSQPS
jgi:hypothetical protein